MSNNDNRTAATGMNIAHARRRVGAVTALRAIVVTTALVTAAALGTAAPVLAQTSAQPQKGQLSAWIDDGWGGGTLISQPAGINCHNPAWASNSNTYQADQSGTCYASFPVGTVVTFTATPDPGSYLNQGPVPRTVTVVAGYNSVWAMFCPDNDLCTTY